MQIDNKEQFVGDILRALERCATGATVHRLNNTKAILQGALNAYQDDPKAWELFLDNATRRALTELALAVWYKPSPGRR